MAVTSAPQAMPPQHLWDPKQRVHISRWHYMQCVGFTRIGEEERRDGEAIALHKTHIWANSLKPVCFLCFLLFWCPLLPFIETGTLKIYTKMVLYMKNEIYDLKYPLHGV